ncbi:hypothetical protein CFC35_00340 [Streptomyces sp. FBKL.4005]|nr:hypothetical protein CFC35_00340 [Streptomyces sp. FBKL.4005]
MEGRACRPDKCDGGWRLRETIAVKAGDFGRSSAFCGDVDQAKGAFTLTMRNPPRSRTASRTGGTPAG